MSDQIIFNHHVSTEYRLLVNVSLINTIITITDPDKKPLKF
jgi:hypothetical protein